MTDWWSTSPVRSSVDGSVPEPDVGWNPEPPPPRPPAPPVQPGPELDQEPQGAPKKDRKKGILLGAVGAAIVGVVVFNAMPDGGAVPQGVGASSSAPQGDFMPPAGVGPTEAAREAQQSSATPSPKVVTLTATPSGKGSVGIVVKVTIHNGTEERVTLLANFIKGDGRPALLGEGTLAPTSQVIEPGQTAEGTVEFAVGVMPQQVTLVDLSGGIVAASS